MTHTIRFFDKGGHDGGKGDCENIEGVDKVVSNSRYNELQKDDNPHSVLRSPYCKSSIDC